MTHSILYKLLTVALFAGLIAAFVTPSATDSTSHEASASTSGISDVVGMASRSMVK
ncbi:MAG TPA: hypothetical protein PLN52_17690 [Opitutaceae bacterium]|nr:hypothetical protein [Opitutaceae bacterium]